MNLRLRKVPGLYLRPEFIRAVACLLLSQSLFAFADGALLTTDFVRESHQRAVILHEKGRETILLSVRYEGKAGNACWVVPVPSRPRVEKGVAEVIARLEKLIEKPVLSLFYISMSLSGGRVEVIEEKQLGIYDIAVLRADEAGALEKWLNAHGYALPPRAGILLAPYVARGWFFVAVKTTAEKAKSYEDEGFLPPLAITFDSEEIVYPLRISALRVPAKIPGITNPLIQQALNAAATKDLKITLFVLADRKVEADGFSTMSAFWLPARVIRGLGRDERGAPWYQPRGRRYLTVLFGVMNLDEETQDAILRESPDSAPVNAVSFSPFRKLFSWTLFVAAALLSPLGYLFVGLFLIVALGRSRIARCFTYLCLFFAAWIVLRHVLSHADIFGSFRDMERMSGWLRTGQDYFYLPSGGVIVLLLLLLFGVLCYLALLALRSLAEAVSVRQAASRAGVVTGIAVAGGAAALLLRETLFASGYNWEVGTDISAAFFCLLLFLATILLDVRWKTQKDSAVHSSGGRRAHPAYPVVFLCLFAAVVLLLDRRSFLFDLSFSDRIIYTHSPTGYEEGVKLGLSLRPSADWKWHLGIAYLEGTYQRENPYTEWHYEEAMRLCPEGLRPAVSVQTTLWAFYRAFDLEEDYFSSSRREYPCLKGWYEYSRLRRWIKEGRRIDPDNLLYDLLEAVAEGDTLAWTAQAAEGKRVRFHRAWEVVREAVEHLYATLEYPEPEIAYRKAQEWVWADARALFPAMKTAVLFAHALPLSVNEESVVYAAVCDILRELHRESPGYTLRDVASLWFSPAKYDVLSRIGFQREKESGLSLFPTIWRSAGDSLFVSHLREKGMEDIARQLEEMLHAPDRSDYLTATVWKREDLATAYCMTGAFSRAVSLSAVIGIAGCLVIVCLYLVSLRGRREEGPRTFPLWVACLIPAGCLGIPLVLLTAGVLIFLKDLPTGLFEFCLPAIRFSFLTETIRDVPTLGVFLVWGGVALGLLAVSLFAARSRWRSSPKGLYRTILRVFLVAWLAEMLVGEILHAWAVRHYADMRNQYTEEVAAPY